MVFQKQDKKDICGGLEFAKIADEVGETVQDR